jgi:hypothetical protein
VCDFWCELLWGGWMLGFVAYWRGGGYLGLVGVWVCGGGAVVGCWGGM